MASNKDTAKYARGLTHAIRNRQTEYLASEKGNVIMGEMYCGKKVVVRLNPKRANVTCKTCLKSLGK